MGDHPQPGQAFMSALVTEHFVLQTARSTTVTEAVGRSGVYLTCVSSALVAFGFFAAATHRLAPVVATVLPALIILGIFTFVRLVETTVESVTLMRRIEAIRRYYAALDPAADTFFACADSGFTGALASTGMHASPAEMFFTSASMIAAVTSILVGVGAALLLDTAGIPVLAAVLGGAGVTIVTFGFTCCGCTAGDNQRWHEQPGQPALLSNKRCTLGRHRRALRCRRPSYRHTELVSPPTAIVTRPATAAWWFRASSRWRPAPSRPCRTAWSHARG
jgi:hypothetical protein